MSISEKNTIVFDLKNINKQVKLNRKLIKLTELLILSTKPSTSSFYAVLSIGKKFLRRL